MKKERIRNENSPLEEKMEQACIWQVKNALNGNQKCTHLPTKFNSV